MNSNNEMLKHKYLEYLKHAGGLADSSILKHEKAVHYYELFFKAEDFSKFNKQKAIRYKERLIEQKLATTSVRTYSNHLKSFLVGFTDDLDFRERYLLTK
jgi:hypothetical protein